MVSETLSLALPYLSQRPLLGLNFHLYTPSMSEESWPLSCFHLSSQSHASSRFPNPCVPPVGSEECCILSSGFHSWSNAIPHPQLSLLNRRQELLTLAHLLVSNTVLRCNPNPRFCQSQTHVSELFWHSQTLDSNLKRFLSLRGLGSFLPFIYLFSSFFLGGRQSSFFAFSSFHTSLLVLILFIKQFPSEINLSKTRI